MRACSHISSERSSRKLCLPLDDPAKDLFNLKYNESNKLRLIALVCPRIAQKDSGLKPLPRTNCFRRLP